jgi:hypothetical protein
LRSKLQNRFTSELPLAFGTPTNSFASRVYLKMRLCRGRLQLCREGLYAPEALHLEEELFIQFSDVGSHFVGAALVSARGAVLKCVVHVIPLRNP